MKSNPSPLEYDECKLFATWLGLKGLMFSHIPNNTYTPSFGAKQRNKALGLQSGLPDYLILTPKGIIFVEMKRQTGGTIQLNQKIWIEAINNTPQAQAQVCFGFQDAKLFVEKILRAN